MKTRILIVVVFLAMLFATMFPMRAIGDSPLELKMSSAKLPFDVLPTKAEVVGTSGDPPSGDPPLPTVVPFNKDMIDAEKVSEKGDGIYVAVLDTGLLSNWQYFFPPGQVNIKTEWGKGYTHDVTYNPTTMQLDFGPLRDDRGFITHDYLNPNPAPNPFGTGLGSGHGTHVTSIVTGFYYNSRRGDGIKYWVDGAAPKVTIIPVLVLDDWLYLNTTDSGWYLETGGTDEMVAAGIRYIGDLAKANHVKIVINMSLGGSAPAQIIEDAIDYAICKGVIIVASAGNEGMDGMGWPGAYPQVISAAAAGWTQEYLDYYLYPGDPNDYYWWTKDVPENLWTTDPLGNKFQVYLTDFSSRPNAALGQHIWDLDVADPGAGVKGPFKNYGTGQWNYYSVWGTSQAAPHVSAIAALVAQDYPKTNQFAMEICLKGAAFANRLTKLCENERSADVFDTFSGTVVTYTWTWKDYGTGLLQADEAIALACLLFGWKAKHNPWN
jgi:subtilisin family serine protease